MNDHLTGIQETQHTLFQTVLPFGIIQRALRIYPKELKLLAWVTLIQVIMSSGSIMLNNTAQTTFLTRYGVEGLPKVFLAEALATLLLSGLVSVLMERFRTVRVFSGLLLFYGSAVVAIRLLIPFDIDLIYPLLYVLKSQSVGILPILYWDILNDLFTTQQSKRLYTLISAGGVLGTTLGSLMTGGVARWIGMDNVLVIFAACMAIAAFLNEMTERVAGAPLEVRVNRHRPGVGKRYAESLQQFMSYAKSSTLLKFMILLLAIPNMLLPLLDYQFNVIVDAHFFTEQSTLGFFGLFRGISNAAIFMVLLFSGRVITRWGVPFSLMIHPINYLAAFGAVFLSFGPLAGIYARFSTEMLKTVLNNPARSVLYNFFPEEIRGQIRLMLRGGVVRIADFIGSGSLYLIKGVIPPPALSLVAIPFVVAWTITVFRLRKSYSQILLTSIQSKQTDWKRLEAEQLAMMMHHRPTHAALLKGLESPDADAALLSAELLSRTGGGDWVPRLLGNMGQRPVAVQQRLLDALTPENARQHIKGIYRAAQEAPPQQQAFWLAALRRLDPAQSGVFLQAYINNPDLRIEAEALAGLFLSPAEQDRLYFRQRVTALLSGSDPEVRTAFRLIGETGDLFFQDTLLEAFRLTGEPEVKAWSIQGLALMKYDGIGDIIASASESSDRTVRMAALRALMIVKGDLYDLKLTSFLQDEDKTVRSAAADALLALGTKTGETLLNALAHPSRLLRAEVLDLIEQMGLPRVTASGFILKEIRKAHTFLACAQLLARDDSSPAAALLKDHLVERQADTIETILRITGALEFDDHMRSIVRVLKSRRQKDIDRAIEILQNRLHADIRAVLIPLLEDRPEEEKIAVGRRTLNLPDLAGKGPGEALKILIAEGDREMKLLCLVVAGEGPAQGVSAATLHAFLGSEDPLIHETAAWAYACSGFEKDALDRSAPPDWVSRLACLRGNPVFKGVLIQALTDIAERCRSIQFPQGDIVVREGSPDDTVYVVCRGKLALEPHLFADHCELAECLLAQPMAGDMACVTGTLQAYTVMAGSDCLLLTLEGSFFRRLLTSCPVITLNLCMYYGRRLREYHLYVNA